MATTREQARTALVEKLETLKAGWTGYDLIIEYPNTVPVNMSEQNKPYLCVSMLFQDGMQIDLSTNPSHRVIGTIVLEAMLKEGSGTRQANELLEYFYPEIHMKDSIPPLRTMAARFASKPAKNGWIAEAAIIPFWYDSLS